MFVDNLSDFGVLVGFAVDDMAPVAPDGANIQEDGLVFGFGAGKGGVAPFVPVDGLMRGGAQVGAGRIFQAVFRMTAQAGPFHGACEASPPQERSLYRDNKNYWMVSPGPTSRGSSGLRFANPSCCRW